MCNDILIKNFGEVLLYNNNHIERRILNKNNHSIIKAITVKAFKEQIELFSPKKFNYFVEKGLKGKVNQETTIAIILKNKKLNQDIVHYHCFNCSASELKNDVPIFRPNAPDGFSMFCNQLEYLQLMNFINNAEHEKKKKKLEEEDILEDEPIPNKKHFLCQICKTHFDNYLEHLSSKIHNINKLKYSNIYDRLKLTFRRIVNFNENQKLNNNKLKEGKNQNKKELDNFNNIESNTFVEKKERALDDNIDNINIITTKEDSISVINDENKDINKEIITEYDDSIKQKSEGNNINISSQDILKILDTVHCNRIKVIEHFKKRNKNDINKDCSNENYIYDFQKISGKISYFNFMNKNTKK